MVERRARKELEALVSVAAGRERTNVKKSAEGLASATAKEAQTIAKCGGSSICGHGKTESKCKSVEGQSICDHGEEQKITRGVVESNFGRREEPVQKKCIGSL
jgi:CobQ-like glutamine amidotransferase family enzyme